MIDFDLMVTIGGGILLGAVVIGVLRIIVSLLPLIAICAAIAWAFGLFR